MCGIYGTTRTYNKDVIHKKLRRFAFRGPDNSGLYQFNNVILGHNRLSIIDLDSRSDQPLHYQHLTLVFNGEIYNYKELKKSLTQKGYNFTTSSDTEILCAAYLEHGQECVKLLNGMFAFVILDKKKNCLFGARDRLGQKPIYYSTSNGSFEFASQPSAIALGNNFKLDDLALAEFFRWRYIPDPLSIYQGIKKLLPGHCFTYTLGNRSMLIEKYWDLDFDRKHKFKGTYQEAKEALKPLLDAAVKKRLMADVPLGVFLSGGIDSSLIASIAQKHYEKGKIKTFNIKFNEKEYDESYYAKQIAKQIGSEHFNILCSHKEALGMIENLSYYYDEPFADSSAIPSMLLAKHTREHVKVALSGDAGDESFLGYKSYDKIVRISKLFDYTTPGIRKLIAGLMMSIGTPRFDFISRALSQKNGYEVFKKFMSLMDDSWILDPKLRVLENSGDSAFMDGKHVLECVSDFDLKTYLNGDINTKVDRASMAFSLEARAPLLDYEVVEFARSLPTDYKYFKGNKKRILKDILFDQFPKSMFDRPKSGFSIPLAVWFKNELRDLVNSSTSTQAIKNLPIDLDHKKIGKLVKDHMDGVRNNSQTIWSFVVLGQWLTQNEAN